MAGKIIKVIKSIAESTLRLYCEVCEGTTDFHLSHEDKHTETYLCSKCRIVTKSYKVR